MLPQTTHLLHQQRRQRQQQAPPSLVLVPFGAAAPRGLVPATQAGFGGGGSGGSGAVRAAYQAGASVTVPLSQLAFDAVRQRCLLDCRLCVCLPLSCVSDAPPWKRNNSTQEGTDAAHGIQRGAAAAAGGGGGNAGGGAGGQAALTVWRRLSGYSVSSRAAASVGGGGAGGAGGAESRASSERRAFGGGLGICLL